MAKENKMKELLDEIKDLTNEELGRANGKFPLFHSDHEGLAVIEEEIFEAGKDFENMQTCFSNFKEGIFMDDDIYTISNIIKIKRYALHCAAELIQVSAMCAKFSMSKTERIENENQA